MESFARRDLANQVPFDPGREGRSRNITAADDDESTGLVGDPPGFRVE